MASTLSDKKLLFWSRTINPKKRAQLIDGVADLVRLRDANALDRLQASASDITDENELLGEIWEFLPGGIRNKVRVNVISALAMSPHSGYLQQFPDLGENIGYTLIRGQDPQYIRGLRSCRIRELALEVFEVNADELLEAAVTAVLEATGGSADALKVKAAVARVRANKVKVGDSEFAEVARGSHLNETSYEISEITRLVDDAQRDALFDGFQALADSPDLLEATKARARDDEIVDPMTIRSRALEAAMPSHRLRELRRTARTVISLNSGSSYFQVYPQLADTVLYEAIKDRSAIELEDMRAEEARGPMERFFRNSKSTLFRDEMQRTLQAADITLSDNRLRAVQELLEQQRMTLGAFNFEQKLFAAMQQQSLLDDYEPLFTNTGLDSTAAPSGDFQQSLRPEMKRVAIELLRDWGVKPTTRDQDWARIALGFAGSGGMWSSFSGFGARQPGIPLKFRRFEDEQTAGLNSERIRVISDLYYIDQFDRLGVFDVVEELGLGMMQRKYDFGGTDVATEVALYTDNLRFQFSADDRREMLSTIFETSNFRALVGRFVEAIIEYARIRNAGELVTSNRPETTVYTRSAVIRSMLNLQRFLSDAGGGFLPYLRDKLHAQLESCFTILERSEVQQRWEGISRSGMWAVVDGIIYEKTGQIPPTDRYRTLAVFGRDWLSWVADNTSTVETLSDAEVDVGAELIQNWISVYRREGPEAEWIDDEDYYAGEENEEDIENVDELADRMEDEAMRDELEADVL